MAIDFASGLLYESAVLAGSTLYYEFVTTNIVSQRGSQMGSRNAGDVASGNVFPFEDAEWATGEASSWQNSRFTAPSSGTYVIGGHLMTDNAAYGITYWYLRKNGIASYWGTAYTTRAASRHYMLPAMFVVTLSTNDYVEPYVADGTMYGVSQAYCRLFGWRIDH
jgi:hypothetical protein